MGRSVDRTSPLDAWLAAPVDGVLATAAIAAWREPVRVVIEPDLPPAVRAAVAADSRLFSDVVHASHLLCANAVRS